MWQIAIFKKLENDSYIVQMIDNGIHLTHGPIVIRTYIRTYMIYNKYMGQLVVVFTCFLP